MNKKTNAVMAIIDSGWEEKMYSINNLVKIYENSEIKTKALDGINLEIEEGKFYVILGESGSGKSTLLNIIGGLDKATSGEINFNGRNLSQMTDSELADYRCKDVGFIFQKFNLIPTLTVWENVLLPVLIEGKKYDEEYVLGILDKLGIADKKDSMVTALSGGQQQRVAVARAFANNPHIILADEPTGNLDSKNGEVVVKMLVEMSKEMHKTILMITHNERIAEVADVVVRIKDGKIDM